MRLLYTLLYTILLPLAFIRLYWRGRSNPGYRRHWLERLGFSQLKLANCIWVHAVSLGETIAAEPLLKRLLADYPNDNIVVTSLTPTGRARAASIKHERLYCCHLPYDLPWALQNFFKRVQPKLLVIMETELWPNLLATTKAAGIPIVLANARMSARSAKGYQRFSALTKSMLKNISCVAVQNAVDGQRLVNLGLPEQHLAITGSIKFDLSIPNTVYDKAALLKQMWSQRPVWIAASTHPNEEQQILAAQQTILTQFPNALLILVPRHPERFIAVKNLIQSQNFTVITRSSGIPCNETTQIYLGDTMGELLVYYASAELAFVGGSLVTSGGHNPLEPAALGLPVITGPHTFNFAEITRLLIAAGAEIEITNSQTLAEKVIQLFADDNLRRTIGNKAAEVVAANRGALDKLCAIIARFID